MARKQGSYSGTTGPKVREAALRLIAHYGYASVSMRQIAAEVGVQVGTLYNYISDKQSLLFDLMRSHMEELLAALAQEDLGQGDAMAQVEAFTRFHIRWHLPRRDAVFISYMELRSLTPAHFAAIEKLRRQYEDALEAILRRGVAEGCFDLAETRLTTMALISLLTGVTHWYKPDGRLDQQAIEAIYVDLMCKSLGGHSVRALAAQ